MNETGRQDTVSSSGPGRKTSAKIAALAGVAGVMAVTAGLVPVRDHVNRAGPALLLVLPVVAAGLLGGHWAAAVTAVASAAALNLAFIPPYWTLKVRAVEDVIALVVFLVVAAAVGTLVADATERRRAAEQRTVEVEQLYRRYEDLAREREHLAEEAARLDLLEKIDEQRAALLSSVSHDLRTPLAIIRAVASDLRSGTAYSAPERDDLLDTIEDEAQRLDRLVANLLSMSRIEAGAFEPDRQAVDVEELVQAASHRLRRAFSDLRLQFDIEANLPLVDGDYSQLDQVVTNLLENAARHAPAGSIVRVTARARPPRMIELRVIDEGIGVPHHERARIFEPFRRGEGSSSSGVGLAICKAVTEAHGGHIEVDRTPGGGATFVVTLPARP